MFRHFRDRRAEEGIACSEPARLLDRRFFRSAFASRDSVGVVDESNAPACQGGHRYRTTNVRHLAPEGHFTAARENHAD